MAFNSDCIYYGLHKVLSANPREHTFRCLYIHLTRCYGAICSVNVVNNYSANREPFLQMPGRLRKLYRKKEIVSTFHHTCDKLLLNI